MLSVPSSIFFFHSFTHLLDKHELMSVFWVPVATWYRGKNRVLEYWVQTSALALALHVTLGKSLNPGKPLFSLFSIDQPALLGAFSAPCP